jgi:tetratricopeptide (TPR) repeat protein
LEEALQLNQQVLQLLNQGQYAAAMPFAERSLAIREKVLGPEHPDVAQSLNNLAELYRKLGNYSQAEPLYQRSLAILEKVMGKEHPLVALSLNNLALLYQEMGNIARTLEFLSRGTNIEERNLALIFTTGSEAQKRDYIATLWGTVCKRLPCAGGSGHWHAGAPHQLHRQLN